MFGHPGISALEYAGQVENEKKRKESVSLSVSKVLSERWSTKSTLEDTSREATASAEVVRCEVPSSPLGKESGYVRREKGVFLR